MSKRFASFVVRIRRFMPPLRMIHDPPDTGTWNMAVDEMMLARVAEWGEPVLRFYEWREPTLSLGYFQAISERDTHAPSKDCPVVRRSTGGGAILHDAELTYSIAVPLGERWSHSATKLYDSLHGSLIETLARLGICATLCGATLHPLEGEPFLCFKRRAQGDVLIQNHKIAGSAQRRRQGAMLQHGSVLLAKSNSAPELLGIQELKKPLFAENLMQSWLASITQLDGFPVNVREEQWRSEELSHAKTIEKEQFNASTWNLRR